jgi:hypothetical protein
VVPPPLFTHAHTQAHTFKAKSLFSLPLYPTSLSSGEFLLWPAIVPRPITPYCFPFLSFLVRRHSTAAPSFASFPIVVCSPLKRVRWDSFFFFSHCLIYIYIYVLLLSRGCHSQWWYVLRPVQHAVHQRAPPPAQKKEKEGVKALL